MVANRKFCAGGHVSVCVCVCAQEGVKVELICARFKTRGRENKSVQAGLAWCCGLCVHVNVCMSERERETLCVNVKICMYVHV